MNKVMAFDAPMGSRALKEMNDAGWMLTQVVTEEYEHYRESCQNTIKKIFYKYRYHHYFTQFPKGFLP